MKEVGDSVHTGEKNLMPSMLKRGWGRIPLLLSMGNAREYERNKLPQQRHRRKDSKKARYSKRYNTEFNRKFKREREKARDNKKQKRRERRMEQETNKSMKDYER